MHIVLANQWFPPEHGGVSAYNAAVARAFCALGHQVTVIAKQPSAEFPLEQTMDGILVRRIPVRDAYYWRRMPGIGRYVRPAQQLAYARRVDHALSALHREQPIDVVEFAEVNAEGFFFARHPMAPFVVRCHTPTAILARYYERAELPFDTRLTAWCEKQMLRRAHALTTPSHDMAQVVAKEYGIPVGSIAVIPNALSLGEFPDNPETQPSNSLIILHVGRLERVKGVVVLARAIPRVVEVVPNARFVFLGGDRLTRRGNSQRAEIESGLDKTQLAHVEFLGEVDHATVREWYRRADICVVPSLLYESFSYTCAQPMAAGKPVVASRIGGIPETVDDGVTGFLVTPGNADELADGIIRLARDPARRERMGRAGSEKAAREFDALRIAQQNIQVYSQAIERFQPGKTGESHSTQRTLAARR